MRLRLADVDERQAGIAATFRHEVGAAAAVGRRVWRWLPVEARRQALTRVTACLAPRPDRHPPPTAEGIAVAGEFSRMSGLGEGARLMERAARQLGLPTWILDVPSPIGERPELTIDATPLPPCGVPLIAHVNAPLWPLAALRLPRGALRGRRVIGHWLWELPTVPSYWRAAVPFVHEIWTMSRFTATALEALQPKPVRVVTPPLALSPPEPSGLDRAAFGWPGDAVVVLVAFDLASSFARKNPLGAISAFRAAFGNRSDRLLVLKVGHPEHAPEDFQQIVAAARAPNIRIETRLLPSGDRYAMTAAADIVFSPHRAEGFGLVLAEAMSLGRAVVATGWSGNMDFMDDENAALVPFRLVAASDSRKTYRNGSWAEPDLSAAADHLRRLADDAGLRAGLGARASSAVRKRLTGASLLAALDAVGRY